MNLQNRVHIWAASWQNQQIECVPSEDSDQPGHPPGLIRVLAVRMKKARVLSYKMSVRPAKTQINLGIRPVWSESLLSAWRKLGSLATHWLHSEDSDQTGRMPRLIWVFAGRTVILLVLSRGGSYVNCIARKQHPEIFEPQHNKTNKMTYAPTED